MRKLCKTVISVVCAACAATVCLSACADSEDYDAEDLSDAALATMAYEGSFTLKKTESEFNTFSDDFLTEGYGTQSELTRTYDAETYAEARLSSESSYEYSRFTDAVEDGDDGVEDEQRADDVPSENAESHNSEERRYFVPDEAGSASGTQYLYTYSDGMDEAMMSVAAAAAGKAYLSDDLDLFGIRFSEFTFREMYTGYLEDILINFLDVEEEDVFSDISVSESGKKADKVSYYEFTSAGTYTGDYEGEARITLSFTVEGGLLTCINFNLYQERVTADGDSPFAETLEYSSRCDVTYSYDAVLMLTEREKEGYYSG